MSSLHIVFASTSGHTEYVVDMLCAFLQKEAKNFNIEKQRAETATPDDLLRGDVLLLASGSWNTGGAEGQLNPYMHMLIKDKAAKIDLAKKKVAIIGLGDDRYKFKAASADHLQEFVELHGGTLITPVLRVINEPYGQENTIEEWAQTILPIIAS